MAYGLSSSSYAAPVYIVNSDGEPVNFIQLLGNLALTGARSGAEMDTQGNPVPTYKPQSFTYDNSGNLATATVSDGTSTWVRSYTTGPTGTTADSGWVKQ